MDVVLSAYVAAYVVGNGEAVGAEADVGDAAGIPPPAIAFTACTREGTFIFHLATEAGIPARAWENLADACNRQTHTLHSWVGSNGKLCINVNKNVVTFNVAKFGDGLGGEILFAASSASCAPAFAEAARLTSAKCTRKQ